MSDNQNVWREYSRVQIHGYDINCIQTVPFNLNKGFCDLVVSGADEKILRILEPAVHFLNLNNTQTSLQLRSKQELDILKKIKKF